MSAQPTHWGAEQLWLDVVPKLPGFTVEVLPQVDSTNTVLMQRARSGQSTPTLLVAESQTAGRGRQGRSWHSQPGDSLMYSLGLMLRPRSWSGLSLVVGMSIAQSLQAMGTEGAAQIGVKWPNDLWLRDGRKLGGTLIETANVPVDPAACEWGSGEDAARFVILGTGINVRTPHMLAQQVSTPPASLQDLDAAWTAPRALQQLLPRLVDDVLLFADEGFAPFQPRFAQWDVLRGQRVHLSDGTQGEAAGVDMDGTLLLRTAHGLHAVLSGDVSVRPVHMALPASSL